MSETNLRLFRTLFQTYPQIGQLVADFLEVSAISIRQPVAVEFALAKKMKDLCNGHVTGAGQIAKNSSKTLFFRDLLCNRVNKI
jgi:hypothetical protein